jgi:hypothetical protein
MLPMLLATPAIADDAFEHTIIVGAGGAGEVEIAEGSLRTGGNVFVEWEAIAEWLELELGASLLAAEGGFELPVDLLFKKPFRVSRHVEVMIGLGPEVVHVSTPAKNGTYAGVEFALDFMFWPSPRVGFWVEPSYDVVFRSPASSGFGSTGRNHARLLTAAPLDEHHHRGGRIP